MRERNRIWRIEVLTGGRWRGEAWGPTNKTEPLRPQDTAAGLWDGSHWVVTKRPSGRDFLFYLYHKSIRRVFLTSEDKEIEAGKTVYNLSQVVHLGSSNAEI